MKKMQFFNNVVHPSLIRGDAEKLVLLSVPPPELHLLMGVVNHLASLLMKVMPDFLVWCRTKGITRHGYQGGGFDGNNSKL